ncbi:MAG: head GIN domain-containing protein [Bacteroidia bacterium]
MNKVITTLCIIAFISFTAFAPAQDHIKGNGKVTSETRAVNGFNKVSLAGSIDLIVDQTGKEGLVVETDENLQNVIITEVENGTLKIHVKHDVSVSPTKMIVHLSCANLNAINSGGSGDVSFKSKLTGDDLKISNGGSGDYKLDVAVKHLDINSGGSGDFVIKGNADTFDFSGAGSGDVNAKDLTSANAKIVTAGSGDVKLRKGTNAKVSSVGSGDVTYE